MALFGWCITGHHTTCTTSMTSDGKAYQCSCKCHATTEDEAS